MRKMVVLAAVVAALAMASQPADARDRGFGSRHFSAHSAPKLQLRHHGLKFHHGGVFGKHRPFQSRHFRHFGQRGLVLKFGAGDLVLRFGHVPFKHCQFSRRHHHHGCSSGSTSHGGSGRGTIEAPPLKIGVGFMGTAKACRVRTAARVADCTADAPPEALLQQLEEMGFRHVPELLRSRDP